MKEKCSVFNEADLCFICQLVESFHNLEIKKRITCIVLTLIPLVYSLMKAWLIGCLC